MPCSSAKEEDGGECCAGSYRHRTPGDAVELSSQKSREVQENLALLMAVLKRLPKVYIHRHLDGAIRPETILQVAEKSVR